jgi:hypothetical protein
MVSASTLYLWSSLIFTGREIARKIGLSVHNWRESFIAYAQKLKSAIKKAFVL